MSMNAAGKHGRRAWLRAMGAWGATGALGAWGVAASPALASNWPVSPITFLQPYGPGTALDAVTRLAAKQIGDQWGVSIVVENRAGANGVVGTEAVARSKPDGSVFLFTGPGHFTNEFLIDKLPYDAARDFKPVARIASVMLVLVVPTSSPFKTAQELIAFAKANPGKLSYSSGGAGSSQHLSAALLESRAGIKALHVPYKVQTQALTDIVGGQVDFGFAALATARGQFQAGKLRLLAVTGPRRSQSLPDVPSLAEAAVPGYSFFSLNAAFAHAAMPDELVRRMSDALAGVSRSREYAELTRNLGIEGDFADVQAFNAAVPAERQFWADLIRTSGAKGG
jgi:tripartite-type tricarboxylate transporter receptor subunit TctC